MRTISQYIFALCATLLSSLSFSQVSVHNSDFASGIGTWTAIDNGDATNLWIATSGLMQIDGTGGTNDEDWLISPSINMNAQEAEYFMFDYNDLNDGNLLELYYSTDYNGGGTSGDLNSANWINIPLKLIDINSVVCFTTLLQRHPAIDISTIKGTASTARQYQIDNVRIEAEYYGSIVTAVNSGLRCADLKTTIHDVIVNQTKIQYTSSNYDIWDAILHLDTRMNDAGNAIIVWDMFTDMPSTTGEFEFDHCDNRDGGSCPGGEGVCYNREHTFPQSWWGGGQLAADTQYVDIHHIVAADRSLNTAKSNNPPGVVTSAFSTGSNGFKVGANPSYPCASMTYFEPIDEYKGDYARIYLYFATRYEHNMVAWSAIANEGDCAMSGNAYPAYEPWLVDVLLTWHAADPVSLKEINRNNAVYAIQGNRNAFIDHPEWVEYVWGDSQGNGCSDVNVSEKDTNGKIEIYPNPSNGVVNVNYNPSLKGDIVVINAQGQVAKTQALNTTINLGQLEKGLYIISIVDENGQTLTMERIVLN